MIGYDKFKNNICSYYTKLGETTDKVAMIKNTLDKIVMDELPNRDKDSLFVVRDLTNSNQLNINFIEKNLYVSHKDNRLFVGVKVPCWKRGWRNICDDEMISDDIDMFFHLSTQYIQRSYQINLIMAILLSYDRICDFRGTFYMESLYKYLSDFRSFIDSTKEGVTTEIHELKYYLSMINSLDSYVNRANCYFIRANELYRSSFFEDAITNLDNTIDIIIQFVKCTKKLPTMKRCKMIEVLSKEFDVNLDKISKLETLYLLRCRFSSHPAQSKWWDFSEIYEDEIEEIFEIVKFTLIKFYQYEINNRRVNPNPQLWSEWFYNHADMLYDSVWFHKLP